MAVVKADAYGHGATAVSRALEEAGADYFAVASLQEAIKLRSANTDTYNGFRMYITISNWRVTAL